MNKKQFLTLFSIDVSKSQLFILLQLYSEFSCKIDKTDGNFYQYDTNGLDVVELKPVLYVGLAVVQV
jgi:hypothetical protein